MNPNKPAEDEDDLPEDDLTSELIAFLDHELPPEQAEVVEARISMNPKIRAEVEAHKLAWDMLDLLPRPQPSASFASRTVERLEMPGKSSATIGLAPSAPSNPLAPSGPSSGITSALVVSGPQNFASRTLSGLGFLTALLLCGVGGWFLREAIYPHRVPVDEKEVDARILSDIRLLENLDLYRNVDNMEFLKTLERPVFFGDEIP